MTDEKSKEINQADTEEMEEAANKVIKENPPLEFRIAADVDPRKQDEFLNHGCPYRGAYAGVIGGSVTYKLTPTTLGTVIKARCHCGKEFDLTAYYVW